VEVADEIDAKSRHSLGNPAAEYNSEPVGDATRPRGHATPLEIPIVPVSYVAPVLEYTGIRVRDLERSKRFYCEGLGLRVNSSGRMAAGGLWVTLEDPTNGAQLELNYYPDAPPYREGDELDHLGFQVESVDLVLDKLKGLGAKVRIPAFREGDERLAFLSDPDGIWIEVWERAAPDEPPASRSGD